MSPEALALLKSLAIRPSDSIAANMLPIVSRLQSAGYVTRDDSGWMASASGCQLLARERDAERNGKSSRSS